MFRTCSHCTDCAGGVERTKMADSGFYRCACGVYFANAVLAAQHKCSKSEKLLATKFMPDQNSKTLFQCDECKNFFDDMAAFRQHPCIESSSRGSSSVSSPSSDLQAEKGIIWNRKQTQLLIQLYRSNIHLVDSGKITKKSLWQTISIGLKEQGYDFNCEQICGRWKSLVRAYKNTKDNNQKSGSRRKTFEFEQELDDLFHKDPAIEPEAILSSATAPQKRSVSDVNDDEDDQGPSTQSGDKTPQPSKKKSCRSNSSELVGLFKTYLEEQKENEKKDKERREQMHTERMQVMNSLISAISNAGNRATGSRDSTGNTGLNPWRI